MAIITVIVFMTVLSIVTWIGEKISGMEERRKDRAAVRAIRNRHIRAAG